MERQLLGQLSEVYAGYFASLSNRGKNREAFRAIERARGRVEAQALEDHEPVAPHEPTTAEKLLTNLNLRLLDTDDVGSRQNILQTIYDTEQQINPNFKPDHFSTEPVDLSALQSDLEPVGTLVGVCLGRAEFVCARDYQDYGEALHIKGEVGIGERGCRLSIRSDEAEGRRWVGAAAIQ